MTDTRMREVASRRQPYCQVVGAPKVAKFREKFADQARR
jgi:hypothetical protein